MASTPDVGISESWIEGVRAWRDLAESGLQLAVAEGLPDEPQRAERLLWAGWCRYAARPSPLAIRRTWADYFASNEHPSQWTVLWSELAWTVACEDPEPRNSYELATAAARGLSESDVQTLRETLSQRQPQSLAALLVRLGVHSGASEAVRDALSDFYMSYLAAGTSNRFLGIAPMIAVIRRQAGRIRRKRGRDDGSLDTQNLAATVQDMGGGAAQDRTSCETVDEAIRRAGLTAREETAFRLVRLQFLTLRQTGLVMSISHQRVAELVDEAKVKLRDVVDRDFFD